MEAQKDSKIRFFLEPIKKIGFDDYRNPSKRRNLKYHYLFSWIQIKIIVLTISLPFILIASCLNPNILLISVPTLLIIAGYILKLKILFQKIAKRIIEPALDLNKNDFVALESKNRLHVYVVIKKSMALYYLKKIELEDIFTDKVFQNLDELNYTELTIIKAQVFYKRFIKIVPILARQKSTQPFNSVG